MKNRCDDFWGVLQNNSDQCLSRDMLMKHVPIDIQNKIVEDFNLAYKEKYKNRR